MSFMNTTGPAGTRDALRAAQAEPDDDEGFGPGIGLALAAHDRLDSHAADIAALKDWTGMPEPDQDEGPGQPDTDYDGD